MKKASRKSWIRWDATWWHGFNIIMTSQMDVWPACRQCAAVCFLSFPWAGRVSHMSINNGNPDLVCKNLWYLPLIFVDFCSSANIFCKQFRPQSSILHSDRFLKKLLLKNNNSRRQQKHEKLPIMQRVEIIPEAIITAGSILWRVLWKFHEFSSTHWVGGNRKYWYYRGM